VPRLAVAKHRVFSGVPTSAPGQQEYPRCLSTSQRIEPSCQYEPKQSRRRPHRVRRRRPDGASAPEGRIATTAAEIPHDNGCAAPSCLRLLPGKESPSPAGSSDLALRPQLAETVLLQPYRQLFLSHPFHLGLPLVLFTHHHGLRSLRQRIH